MACGLKCIIPRARMSFSPIIGPRAVNGSLFLLSDGARKGDLEGFRPISGIFEGFVDNITDIWIDPLRVI